MISRLFDYAHIFYQAGDNYQVPEPALGVHIDGNHNLMVEQEGRYVIINRQSVPELCKLLKEMAKKADELEAQSND